MTHYVSLSYIYLSLQFLNHFTDEDITAIEKIGIKRGFMKLNYRRTFFIGLLSPIICILAAL